VELIRAEDIELLHPLFYAGFVCALYRPASLEALGRLDRTRRAAVNEAPEGVPLVRSNEAQGMELAVARLAERGHRRIELFLPSPATRTGAERAAGFRTALKRRGLPTDGVVFDTLGDKGIVGKLRVRAAIDEFRVVRGGATAFVAAGEEAGLLLHRAIRQTGLRVPDDVSLVAMEHSGVSDKLDPPHTTLVQNFTELARRAVALAVGETMNAGTSIPYGFIERSTIREIR
jgi:DNA-binding LacI/PurR family transcriptional regulator